MNLRFAKVGESPKILRSRAIPTANCSSQIAIFRIPPPEFDSDREEAPPLRRNLCSVFVTTALAIFHLAHGVLIRDCGRAIAAQLQSRPSVDVTENYRKDARREAQRGHARSRFRFKGSTSLRSRIQS